MSETTTENLSPPSPAAEQQAAPPEQADQQTEQVEQTEQTEQKPSEAKPSRGDRRYAQLTAQLAAQQRTTERLSAELEFMRAQQGRQQMPPGEDTPEAAEARLRASIRAEEAGKLRAEAFHAQGRAEFADWKTRCDTLMDCGADAGFAALLVDMPGGAKVAAALADDPEEVQRIASIRSERGRAVALGRYAAQFEVGHAQRPSAPVTRAPPPVRPVTGRVAPVFNEYAATSQELVDHYMKQDLERRQARR